MVVAAPERMSKGGERLATLLPFSRVDTLPLHRRRGCGGSRSGGRSVAEQREIARPLDLLDYPPRRGYLRNIIVRRGVGRRALAASDGARDGARSSRRVAPRLRPSFAPQRRPPQTCQ